MHARLTLLSSTPQGQLLCDYAERVLTDISAAFDHGFSMFRGKIEPDQELTDKTLRLCESSQAIFMGDGDHPAAQTLYDLFDLPLRIRAVLVPEGLCSRGEKPMKVWLGTVLSLDDDTLRRAAREAFRFAREEDTRVLHIAPTGATREAWDAALRVQGADNPLISLDGIAAPEAIASLIRTPDRMGLLVCPPYAGGIFEAALTALCPHPEVIFDYAGEEKVAVYAPHASIPQGNATPAPFSAALAVARMLRVSLHLSREAACLDAAIQNVLVNNWKEDGNESLPDAETCLELISQQIAVAGELMSKGGIAQ